MKQLLVGAIATLLGASGAIAQTFNPGPPLASPGTISSATVISIGDGDTLRVSGRGQVLTIRLACIDAPETAQKPWGQRSTAWLKQKLPLGQTVQIRKVTVDRYDRTVAELYLGKRSLNLWLVQEGQAVVYRQYLNGCKDTKDQYLQGEAIARQKRLGFWNQPNPVMPWDFRRKRGLNGQL